MEKLYKLLSDAQASLFVLFFKTWNYHLTVVGSDSPQLHILFGDQYKIMFEEVDRISENMRALNIRPISALTRIVEVSQVDQPVNINQSIDANGMVKQLLNDNEIIINQLQEIANESEKQQKGAISNMAQDLQESHSSFVFKLRSYLG
jgi:starvation-inducible DNA-binding protein